MSEYNSDTNREDMCLTSPATIKAVMKTYGFAFSKSLGQNFLIDSHIVDKIVEAAFPQDGESCKNGLVIEIGPGFGVLTQRLCSRAEKVIAIEKDKKIPPILAELVPADNLQIIEEDALKLDWDRVITEAGYESAIVVANLPYYITTPIIMSVLENAQKVKGLVVMMQKEVADRILDEGDRGAITLSVAYYADSERVVNVRKNSFMPAPKVDSAVLKIRRKEALLSGRAEVIFFQILRAIYSSRRKTLLNSLKSLKNISKNDLNYAIIESGCVQSVRGETLNIEQLAKLSQIIAGMEDINNGKNQL